MLAAEIQRSDAIPSLHLLQHHHRSSRVDEIDYGDDVQWADESVAIHIQVRRRRCCYREWQQAGSVLIDVTFTNCQSVQRRMPSPFTSRLFEALVYGFSNDGVGVTISTSPSGAGPGRKTVRASCELRRTRNATTSPMCQAICCVGLQSCCRHFRFVQ